jgi:hypothetical protein
MIHQFMKVYCIAAGILAFACAGTVAFAQKPSKPDPKAEQASQAQQQEYSTVIRLADTAMSGQPVPNDFPIQFQNDFLRAIGGRVWVPMTLTLDPIKIQPGALTMYVRIAPRGATAPPPPPPPDKNDKSRKDPKKNDKTAPPPAAANYPYEDIALLDLKPAAPGQPIRIVRGLGVGPGSYDLYIVLHERTLAPNVAAKASVLKQPLDVPNYANGEFTTSSVILADRVDQLPSALPSDQQTEHPYTFGSTEILVSPEHKFKKSQELIVLLQIYNPAFSPDKKFNLEATYTFFRQDQPGEKRFNSTEPQTLTPESLGGSFDPAGSAAIQAGQAIALQTFPEGNYRLEIKITDKLSSKVLTQNVNFSVAP